MTALEEFRARRSKEQERGLVDMKFFVSPRWAGDENELFAASNAFDAADGTEVEDLPLILPQTDVRELLA